MPSGEPPLDKFVILNREFYASAPQDYFDQRLHALLVAAADVPSLNVDARTGMNIGWLNLTIKKDERVAPDYSDDKRAAFVTADSQVLLHHAAEALMRLYLAHEEDVPCPWLEVSSLTSFRQFKETLKARFVDGGWSRATRKKTARVFIGSAEWSHKVEVNEDDWNAQVDVVMSYLRHYSKMLLDESHLYNAAKHGFAVNPSNTSLHFRTEGEGASGGFGHKGPSIDFLSSTQWNNGVRDWSRTTHWVGVRGSLILTQVAIILMFNLWTVARSRYVGDEGTRLYRIDTKLPVEMLHLAGDAASITNWSERLFAESKPPK